MRAITSNKAKSYLGQHFLLFSNKIVTQLRLCISSMHALFVCFFLTLADEHYLVLSFLALIVSLIQWSDMSPFVYINNVSYIEQICV